MLNGKYLLLEIGGIRDEEMEDLFIAISNLRDHRGLRVAITPLTMWTATYPWRPDDNKVQMVTINVKTSDNS